MIRWLLAMLFYSVLLLLGVSHFQALGLDSDAVVLRYFTVPSWSREVTATGWQHWIYVYHFTIMHFSNTGPLISYQNVKLRFMHGFHGSNGLFHVLTRCNVRSREVSKPWDLYVELSDRSEIWQPSSAALLSMCLSNFKVMRSFKLPESRGFETSRDLTVRRRVLSDIEKVPRPGFRFDSEPIPATDGRMISTEKCEFALDTGTRHSAEKKQCISLATGIFWW